MTYNPQPMIYADVHTHLTHNKFASDLEETVRRARQAGLAAIVVNGLEPASNRRVLELAGRFDVVRAALGIYPVDAVCRMLPDDFTLNVARFDVDAEIQAIAEFAAAGRLAAVGECGLDGHWLESSTFTEQERVFEALVDIAMQNALPVIVHTRKREVRAAEILRHMGARFVDFHCYGGRVKNALRWAREDGWWFSIPANARRNEAFSKLLRELPSERILTETDAPFLSPRPGGRSEPADVVDTAAYLAELRGWLIPEAADRLWRNFESLMSCGDGGA